MQSLIDQSGLVARDDYLSLSRSVTLTKEHLQDNITNAKHKLHIKAVKCLEVLDHPIPYELWINFSREQKLSEKETLEVLLFLNEIGALDINRSLTGFRQINQVRFKTLTKGITPILRAKRWPANIAGISLATIAAMLPLILAVTITGFLAFGVNIAISAICFSSICLLFAVWFSTVMHEWIHCLVIARKKKDYILLQRGLRIGVLHEALPTRLEVFSATSGPIVGALASLIACLLLGFLLEEIKLSLVTALLVAVFQLTSLLPFYGDGQMIWDNLRRML